MKNVFFCVLLVLASCVFSLGQTYKVLWSFGGAPNDGGRPYQGLIADGAGNLYGTTSIGGNTSANCPTAGYIGCGTVFELSPSNGSWKETILYEFCLNGSPNNCPDGYFPYGQLVMDASGNLYGSAFGGVYGYGTIFELSPPSFPGGVWTEQVLWNFCSEGYPCPDGDGPNTPLVMDAAGNLYGTSGGGEDGFGTVFEVSPGPSGATETTLYLFGEDGSEGYSPRSGVILDASGNLYGTTVYGGGYGYNGMVYELSPTPSGPWTETTLYTFSLLHSDPYTGVRFDSKGNLYGTTSCSTLPGGGCNLGGSAIFRLAPQTQGGGWRISFLRMPSSVGNEGPDPLLVGEIFYGATSEGGAVSGGTVFQLRGTTQTVLYNFCSQTDCTDGEEPYGGGSLLMLGGRLYGTTIAGGASGQGVVFQIAP